MGLNKSTGNMYDFVTHTWNTIKGKCYHDCSYCYMKRFGNQKPVRFDEKELKTDLCQGNFIFVGSSCDMFSNCNYDWILSTLSHCKNFDNSYLFQTKNPFGLNGFVFPKKTVFCTTIETNRWYPEIMNQSPKPLDRVFYLYEMASQYKRYITIEPVMDFDLSDLIRSIKICEPVQVNIGADSGNNNLPEPPKEKILELISELSKFTKVKQKKNLKRLLC